MSNYHTGIEIQNFGPSALTAAAAAAAAAAAGSSRQQQAAAGSSSELSCPETELVVSELLPLMNKD
eukprot:COSAG02_NODE_7842_length_2823_cov_1.637665_4_plen_66_part_00